MSSADLTGSFSSYIKQQMKYYTSNNQAGKKNAHMINNIEVLETLQQQQHHKSERLLFTKQK